MSITADLIRGHTETIILAALMEGDSYGYRINRGLNLLTDGRYELKEATLYTAFRRLEENGFIRSYWGDESTGARRRYYAITPLGSKEYSRRVAEWEEARDMLDKLITVPRGEAGTWKTEATTGNGGINHDGL